MSLGADRSRRGATTSRRSSSLREVGNRSGEGDDAQQPGRLAYESGAAREARGYYEQALVIQREVGNRSGEGTTLNNLGELARSLGQPEQARGYYEQALVIAREVGDRSGKGRRSTTWASLAYESGADRSRRSALLRAGAAYLP